MNSQSNLEEENLGQEEESSLETKLNKVYPVIKSSGTSESKALESDVFEGDVVEGDLVEDEQVSEDGNPPSKADPLADLLSFINELDVAEVSQLDNGDSSVPIIAKAEQASLPKSDQNEPVSFASEKKEEAFLLPAQTELNRRNVNEDPAIDETLLNSLSEDNQAEQLSSDSEAVHIITEQQTVDSLTVEIETTQPETVEQKSPESIKLEYADDLYDHDYIGKITKQDDDSELGTSISLLNIVYPDPQSESSFTVSPHWIVQKERQINDLAASLNSLIPLVVELSQVNANSSREHILKNLVPIIDQVIQKRSTEDQQKMAKAIANLLPTAIQQEIRQEPNLIGQAIAPELALSITEQIRLDEDAIAEALGSEMGKAIKNQIEREREAMVDALYPVIGSTIAKYMAEVIESINEKVDNALSPKGIQRKIRAKVQGVSEAELIFQESFPYQVQAVFLIQNNSGLVIAEFQPQQESQLESDLLAGMLTAIRSFANDCIASNSELDEIDYGNFKIMFETAGYCYLAVVVNGEADRRFRERIRLVFTSIVQQYGDEIEEYQGDQDTIVISAIKSQLAELQTDTAKDSSSQSPKTLYWLVGILMLMIFVPWGIFHYRNSVRRGIENNVAIELDANPELSVYRLTPKVKKKKLLLKGRVPTRYLAGLATRVTIPLAEEAKLELDNQIVAIKIPIDPTLTKQEVARTTLIVNQNSINRHYASITTSYADRTVTINGLFVDETGQQRLVNTFKAIPGVDNVIFVINNQLPQLNTRIYFPAGVTRLSSVEELAKLDDVLVFLKKYPYLKLKIVSHSDHVGSKEANLKLSKSRSEDIYQNLINRGVQSDRLKVVATIQPPPDIIESQSASLKRCIRFEPFGINK